jgi:hypothetical protein
MKQRKRKNHPIRAVQKGDSISPVKAKENKKYKDSVFVDLFSKCSSAKENALSLYNALHGTAYDDESKIQFFVLDDILYQNFRNDISFIFNEAFLILSEHQSTINNNMPVRFLMYVAREYEKLIPQEAKYKRELVQLPKPEFVTFYNGIEAFPKEKILRLSEAFMEDDGQPNSLELEVKVININPDMHHEILDNCEVLSQYSQFVDITRKCENDEERLKDAIMQCIEQNILADYLKEKGSEVRNMLVSEYSYEMDIAVQRAESEAKGVMRGRLEGRREGRLEGQTEGSNNKGIQVFLNCKKRGMSDQDAQAIADISDELVKIALKDNELC